MAPTKNKDASTPKPEAKKGKDRIIKRPARGFHRFRSGILNVTPKGGERDLVKNNQYSPLLGLPGELRNRIWEYVLGGKTLRPRYNPRLRAARQMALLSQQLCGPMLYFALLQTCRQIYTETALLPYKLSIFASYSYSTIHAGLRQGRRYQLAHIFNINIMASLEYGLSIGHIDLLQERATLSIYNLDFLPALKRLNVLISEYQVPDAQIESYVTWVRPQLEVLLAGRGIQLVIKVKQNKTSEYETRHSCTLS